MDTSRRKRIRKSKTQRQEEIVDATLRLVPKYGLRGTTVSRIAGAVGMSRGALYQHFANREAVVFAAMERMAERAARWVSSASGRNAYERLLDLSTSHAPFTAAELETFVRPSIELMATSGKADLAEQVRGRQLRTFQAFLEMVEEGKRDGSIRADVESEDIAWALLNLAWVEDLARVMELRQLFDSGATSRNFARILAAVAGPARDEPGSAQP
jgi:AcrR family transcriptional regulator